MSNIAYRIALLPQFVYLLIVRQSPCTPLCVCLTRLAPLLLGTGTAGKLGNRGIDAPDVAEQQLIHEIASLAAETWFEIAHWAKETGNLLPWQRSLTVSLGKLASQEKTPSRKQALRGMEILEEIERLGFKVSA